MKHKASVEEITNDNTLLYTAYGKWELVEVIGSGELYRFVGYTEDGCVRLATLAMGVLPETYSPLCIRRPIYAPASIPAEQKRAKILLDNKDKEERRKEKK